MSEQFSELSTLKEYSPYIKRRHTNPEYGWGSSDNTSSAHHMLPQHPPTNSQTRQLIDYYFQNIHHHYPFVHPKEFDEKYQEGQVSTTLINSICAVASRYRASITSEEVDTSYAKAVEEELLLLIDEPTLESSQAMLHMCIYELARGNINRAGTYSATAIRMAQGLGFFRLDEVQNEAKHLTASQWINRETSRRVWWFSYIFDVYVGVAIVRPPLINEDDCCSMLPCVDDKWEQGQPVDTMICRFDRDLPSQVVSMVTAPNTGLLAIHVALITIMARTLRGIMRFGTLTPVQKDYVFPQIKFALEAWETNLPPQYRYKPEETIKGNPYNFSQIAFLDSMRHAIDIWIHLPVFGVKATPKAPNVTETVIRCFTSAKMIAFAVQEVNSTSIIEADPMYSVCIFFAARFFLQGCKSKDRNLAQRSLKFYRFLHNTLQKWKALWGVIDIHFSILNECFSRISMAQLSITDVISPDPASTGAIVSGMRPGKPSNINCSVGQPSERTNLPSSCVQRDADESDTHQFECLMTHILTQNPQRYDLSTGIFDSSSIWGSPREFLGNGNQQHTFRAKTELDTSNLSPTFPATAEQTSASTPPYLMSVGALSSLTPSRPTQSAIRGKFDRP
ncbi:hypothetical protein K493DRAFT_296952 [Basidiobolus meristosporus CBS 931.73]|uniref:Xylanolytic transcriptional activator regulatory domain-containing protein n=1 Tax=Basidiobolus meristosporus CBS 931.73 TaxID=1314790 RepID=A0A1Y1Z2J3_9FUNG|nr:hypothetical protein K493DRAFT_296952 [Basidiobolus meristosporus CBS 931.73]|eukprot:ORY04511.1 hypothetical protein K493DRAFT_296952 [Basidiobolus meristosporus CBS 931.73]